MSNSNAFSSSPPDVAVRRTASLRSPVPVVHGGSRLATSDSRVRSSFAAAWIAGSSPAMTDGRTKVTKKNKGSGTPTDAYSYRPRLRRGSVLSGARSPVGVPPRLFLRASKRPCPASGQASWDAAATITLLSGRYPPLPVPVQWHPRPATYYRRHDAQSRPGEVCETARGHRTRSVIRIASGIRP